MRSTSEAPPQGWIVEPPLVKSAVREWSFESVCREVKAQHPDWPILQVQEQVELQNAARCVRIGASNFTVRTEHIATQVAPYGSLVIRRSMANGDAIAATCVADSLLAQGYAVTFQTARPIIPLIQHHPHIQTVMEPVGTCDVNLDGAYENHSRRFTWSYSQIFIEAANNALNARGIRLSPANATPRLKVPQHNLISAQLFLHSFPRPWIMCCPSSFSHRNRTVPPEVWIVLARMLPGTCFWLGQGQPPRFVPLPMPTLPDLLPHIGSADLMITVDTGPMHIAAALGIPMVAIEQASRPELHLSDQRDFVVVRPDLTCLNCLQELCPLNSQDPPCAHIDPDRLARAAYEKLRAYHENGVSAIVCIYQPPSTRLNRCLTCLLPQVDEIVISVDHGGFLPVDTLTDPKIKVVHNRTGERFGYGRNANFGARHSSHRWILLVNDDVFLHEGAVTRLREVATEGVGIVAQLLFYPDGTIQHGGTYRNPGDIGFGHIDLGAREPRYKEPLEMENVTLASALVPRKAFYEIRGFDERFVFYCEDNDFCMRMRQAGWKIIFQPKATGIHQEHQSTHTIPDVQRIMTESQAIFAQKWSAYFDWNRYRIPGNFDYLKR